MAVDLTPSSRIIVIERTPWFSSGLRREWSNQPRTVLFRDRFDPRDFAPDDRPDLVLIDLDTLPAEGLRAIDQLTRTARPLAGSIVVVLNASQRNRAAELLSLGIDCYFVKPVPVFEVARSGQNLLKAQSSTGAER